MYIRNFIVYVW